MTRRHCLPIPWWLVPLGMAVIAGHLVVPYALAHAARSTAIASSVLLFLTAKHLGLAGVLVRRLRRRSEGSK